MSAAQTSLCGLHSGHAARRKDETAYIGMMPMYVLHQAPAKTLYLRGILQTCGGMLKMNTTLHPVETWHALTQHSHHTQAGDVLAA